MASQNVENYGKLNHNYQIKSKNSDLRSEKYLIQLIIRTYKYNLFIFFNNVITALSHNFNIVYIIMTCKCNYLNSFTYELSSFQFFQFNFSELFIMP